MVSADIEFNPEAAGAYPSRLRIDSLATKKQLMILDGVCDGLDAGLGS